MLIIKQKGRFIYTVVLAGVIFGSVFYFNSGHMDMNIVDAITGRDDATLIFVGDIMLSRSIGRLMVKSNDWSYPFANVKDFLKRADLTFANFENPMSNRGVLLGSIYSFRADPLAIEGMTTAGFDVVSIANNHIWDYGQDAFEDTRGILNENGITPVGGGDDFNQAHTAVIKDVKGTKIAFLAYTDLLPKFLGSTNARPAVASPSVEQITVDVTRAKQQADIVVTSFHWGEEYQTVHNPKQELLAHAAVDAGADLVIGHHPHVIQDVEKYKNSYIAYSLGNFVFDQNFSEDTSKGLVIRVTVVDKKVTNFEQLITTFNKTFQPSL